MGVALATTSFNGGETSELMWMRADNPRVKSGCKVLLNMVCIAQGPATRRGGFMFLGEAADQNMSNNVRIEPFVYSAVEPRVLEFSNLSMRVWKDDALVMDGASAYALTTTYTSAQLMLPQLRQSNNVIYIASHDHKPAKITRTDDDDWALADLTFIPETETPSGLSITAVVGGTPTSAQKLYRYVVTAISDTDGEESTPSDEISVTTSILNSIDGNYNEISWDANAIEPLEYRVYKYEVGSYGFIGRLAGDAATLMFTDDNIGADEEDTPPISESPFETTGDYPALVFFWEQRLGWASTVNAPFTVRMSPSSQFDSLAASVPPIDSDAIEAQLATAQANRIQWIEGDRVLLMGTTGNEWQIGKADEALTPAVGFGRQGGKGSEAIPALVTSDSMLFVQRGGDVIRELIYSYNNDRYDAPEVSLLASHLFDGKAVVAWAYQLNPYSIVWIVLDDGSLVGMTYMREHEVVGWHRHETDGFIEDICCVPGAGYDRVHIVVRRTINGTEKRFIERMGDYFVRSDSPEDAFFVDCGVTETYDPPTLTWTAIAPHLVGETVKVWADGAEQAEQVVGALGTVVGTAVASKVTVGLGMVSDVVPNRPELSTDQGTTIGKLFKVGNAKVRLYRSMNVKAGADEDTLEPILTRDATEPAAPKYATEDAEFPADTGWTPDWDFIVRADGPAPMTVLGIMYDTDLSETI